jgi:Predicted metal-binding integral membrane protein (DUF2182)
VGETRLGPLTALVGVGYFLVWTVFGMAVFPLGLALAAVEMQQPALARAVPIAVGVVVLVAGALQFSAWKARHLMYGGLSAHYECISRVNAKSKTRFLPHQTLPRYTPASTSRISSRMALARNEVLE